MSSTTAGVGFVLPNGTRSNATNLVTPGVPINLAVDPWSILADPSYGVPTPQQQSQWNQLCCQRYGQPKPGYPLPEPGTAMHSTDFQSALQTIAQLDPGWFAEQGYGPGPAGRNGIPTQLEIHDAQYAMSICNQVIQHAAEIQPASSA